MPYFKKSFAILSLASIFFQGCSNTKSSPQKKNTAVGKATSISYSSKEKSDLEPLDIEILNRRLALLLKSHIHNINIKEATSFAQETNYCTISGLQLINNSGAVQSHLKNISFHLCEDDETIQNGDIEIAYHKADEDGRFPKLLELKVIQPYFFNDLNLTKDTKIEVSNIVYDKDGTIVSFNTIVTGQVIIDKHKVFRLQSFEQRIGF